MFKKKKPLAKHENVKLAGALQQQAPIDLKKIVKLSNEKLKRNGTKKG